ncbi:MAG: glutathione S-transferase family protein [Paracoccaceae bacterium]
MAMLINGRWDPDAKGTVAPDGSFVRAISPFRNKISDPGEGEFPAEAGRYNLIVSYACPWAHRTLIYRALLDLEEVINVSIVHPISYPDGWTFNKYEDVINLTGLPVKYLRDLYLSQDPNFTGKVTVPTLWDKKTKKIVNNESSEIIRMLDGAFSKLKGNKPNKMLSNYPINEIESMNEFIYKGINNGVYRVGFATTQQAYEDSVELLFKTLDQVEQQLTKNEFLLGSEPCEADWRLIPTLIRFDTIYYYHFKCNRRKLSSYLKITEYLKKLLNIQKIKGTIHDNHIIDHYYLSHVKINPFGIIPIGVFDQMSN